MSTETPDAQPKKSLWEKGRLIAAAVGALLVLIVVLQNTQAVETKILFLTLTMPRAALLLGTLLVGFALGYLVANIRFRKTRKKGLAESANRGKRGTDSK